MISQIINGDCLEGLKSLPDKSIDLVVTDPPYYFGENPTGGGIMSKRKYTAQVLALNEQINTDVLDQCLRVLKNPNFYIWCNKKQIGEYIRYFEDQGCITDILTWHKINPVPAFCNHYLNDTEYCLFFRKSAPLYGNYNTMSKYWITHKNTQDKDRYGHPTIKPLEIIKKLIFNSTQAGGVVLDPYLGSGTVAVACKILGRQYIGYEIDPKYYQIAKNRLAEVNTTLDDFIGGWGCDYRNLHPPNQARRTRPLNKSDRKGQV